ncbi:MAG: hypothetical protein A2Y38_01875 [Spirochaetes bacterium GWB1_59_5]|nr:MAG: hypothetical protein A2Y38_01875 [Spirochaetes bacterium GWB1_59_5]
MNLTPEYFMSLYLPAAIAANDQPIILPPYFGGEFAAYASHKLAKLIASITQSVSNAGTLTDNAANAISAAGANLQVVAVNYLRSSAACVIELSVNGGTPAKARFAPVTRAADQSFNFQAGYATDLLNTGLTAGVTVTAVDSLTSIVGGGQNVEFAIYELPVWPDDYFLIGCTTAKNFNTKGRVAKGVDCGMKTDAFVKRGKTKPANLTISQKFFGMGDGLARLDGGKATCMLRGIKDWQLTGDVLVFTNWVPTFANDLPDGDGEAMQSSDEGKYEELLMFVAPDA